jgi:four helix bundle protein
MYHYEWEWSANLVLPPQYHRMATGRSKIGSYRDLIVWQRAMDLADVAYDLTKSFPKDERFGLISQVQRSAVSIPSNIAEGHGRKHLGEYLHHLSIANGSLMELETQLTIASRRDYISSADVQHGFNLSGDVGRLLAGLIRALKARRPDTRHQTPILASET